MSGRRRTLVALLCGALLSAACSTADDTADGADIDADTAAAAVTTTDEQSGQADPEPAESVASDASEAPPTRFATGSSDLVFDPTVLHTFELTLTEENLARIDSDPGAEEWVEGSLTFDGERVDGVGIRYKGSVGAFVGCVANPDFSIPRGEKTCTKLSMKVKFDRVDPDQTFYGLRRLQFHSMNNDPSMLRERLGYHLFRESGVPTSRATHARLLVNGEFVGLFALVEELDGRFTDDRFGGDGNLFKEVWPITDEGEPTPRSEVVAALRTNADAADVDAFLAAADDLASADPGRMAAAVERFGPLPDVMAFLAVDRAIGNDDGPLHWYCGAFSLERCENHNYYWYEDEASGAFRLVPWDLDNTFQNLRGDVNPVTPIADDWNEISNDCEPLRFGGLNLYQRSPACDPLTAAWTADTDALLAAVTTLLDGPFAAAAVDELLDEWSDQIADAVAEAAELHDDAVSVDGWKSGIDELRRQIDQSRRDLRALVDES